MEAIRLRMVPVVPKRHLCTCGHITGWRKGVGDDFVGFGIKDYNPDNIDPNVGIEMTFNCPGV